MLSSTATSLTVQSMCLTQLSAFCSTASGRPVYDCCTVLALDTCLLQVRGRLVLLYELLLCGGMLGSLLADVALMHLPDNWRWMVGLPVLPAAVLAGTLCVVSVHQTHSQSICGLNHV